MAEDYIAVYSELIEAAEPRPRLVARPTRLAAALD